jgi:hypothetical protein
MIEGKVYFTARDGGPHRPTRRAEVDAVRRDLVLNVLSYFLAILPSRNTITEALSHSDLLFACRQQSREVGTRPQILSSYRFNKRLPMANVVCICRLLHFSIREVFFRCRIHLAAGRRACRRSRPEVT